MIDNTEDSCSSPIQKRERSPKKNKSEHDEDETLGNLNEYMSKYNSSISQSKLGKLRLQISDSELRKIKRQASIDIMRRSNNLDLDTYAPFIFDFQQYSINIFDLSENIFKEQLASSLSPDNILKRTTPNETQKFLKLLKNKYNDRKINQDVIDRQIKKLPPFQGDKVDLELLESFQKQGNIGWQYLQFQMFHNDKMQQRIQEIINKRNFEIEKKKALNNLSVIEQETSQVKAKKQKKSILTNVNSSSVFDVTNGNVYQDHSPYFERKHKLSTTLNDIQNTDTNELTVEKDKHHNNKKSRLDSTQTSGEIPKGNSPLKNSIIDLTNKQVKSQQMNRRKTKNFLKTKSNINQVFYELKSEQKPKENSQIMKNSKTHVPNSIEFFIYNSNIPKFDEYLETSDYQSMKKEAMKLLASQTKQLDQQDSEEQTLQSHLKIVAQLNLKISNQKSKQYFDQNQNLFKELKKRCSELKDQENDEVLVKVTVINKHSYENDLNIEGTIKIGIYQDNLLKYIFIKKSPNDKIHPKKFIQPNQDQQRKLMSSQQTIHRMVNNQIQSSIINDFDNFQQLTYQTKNKVQISQKTLYNSQSMSTKRFNKKSILLYQQNILNSYQDKTKPNLFNNYSPMMTKRHNSKSIMKKQKMRVSQNSSRNKGIDIGQEQNAIQNKHQKQNSIVLTSLDIKKQLMTKQVVKKGIEIIQKSNSLVQFGKTNQSSNFFGSQRSSFADKSGLSINGYEYNLPQVDSKGLLGEHRHSYKNQPFFVYGKPF